MFNTDPTSVANIIGEYFHDNSSDKNYTKCFIERSKKQPNQQLISNVNPHLEEQMYLNTTISFEELRTAIFKCRSHSSVFRPERHSIHFSTEPS